MGIGGNAVHFRRAALWSAALQALFFLSLLASLFVPGGVGIRSCSQNRFEKHSSEEIG